MKSYFQHDPILDKGKAVPKAPTREHYHKARLWVDGGSPRRTKHNSRIRMSKKRRIALRDAEAIMKGGVRYSMRRQFRAWQMAGAVQALRAARKSA